MGPRTGIAAGPGQWGQFARFQAAGGHSSYGLTVLEVQDVRIDPSARRVWRAEREIVLSRKEYDLLHALASCLTAGMANIAAARGVTLTEVRSTVRGDIDLNGIFGLQPVRNGYQQVEVRFVVKGDAPEEVLRSIVEQSRRRSAVYDVITNGVPVDIEVEVA